MLKYEQVAHDIEHYIEDNNLQAGDKLPVLDDLTKEYDVSRSTVSRALEVLELKGIIYQVRGSGIFVRGHKRKGYINLVDTKGFHGMLNEFTITSKVLALEVIPATEDIAYHLDLAVGDEVYFLERIRYIEGRPFNLERSYYNKAVVTFLNEQIAEGSVFDYIADGLNVTIGFSDAFLRVGHLKEDEAAYLNLKKNDPSILVESIFHTSNGIAFDYSKVIYNYEESQFFIQSKGYY